MKIRRIDLTPFRIPFRRPFLVAGKPVPARAGILVQVHGDDGNVGLGEVSPHPTAAPAVIRDAMEAMAQVVSATDLSELWDRLAAMPSPMARVGLEMASADLAARAAGRRVGDEFGGVVRERVPVNAIIDEPGPARAAAAAQSCVAQGFRCLKLKLAPGDIAPEAARVAAVRDAVGPAVRLRVDANAAWTVAEAIAAIPRLAVHGLEYVEQPVADITGLAQVRRAVRTPIAADECVTGTGAVERLAAAQAADVVIVKPTLLGLRTSAAVIRRAAACGLGMVVTSALDTSIGIAAALQLAATLPEPALACGLATASLLAGDLVREPLAVHDGWIRVPEQPGLGVQLDDAALQRWRVSL